MSPNCEFVDFVFQTVVVNAEILQKNKKKMNPYFCKDSIAVLHKSGFDKKKSSSCQVCKCLLLKPQVSVDYLFFSQQFLIHLNSSTHILTCKQENLIHAYMSLWFHKEKRNSK